MYKLRDDGYASFKKIMNGRRWVGRVSQTAGGFLAKIENHQAEALTEMAALHEVVAKIQRELVETTPESRIKSARTSTVQADTECVIQWLRELSGISDGHPKFTNADVARTLGKKRSGQDLGNLMSRLDFACYVAGLPQSGVLRKSHSLMHGNNKIALGNGRSGKCGPPQKLIRGVQVTLIIFYTKRSV